MGPLTAVRTCLRPGPTPRPFKAAPWGSEPHLPRSLPGPLRCDRRRAHRPPEARLTAIAAPGVPRGGIRRPSRRQGRHEIGDTPLGRWMRLYIPVLFFLFVTLFPFYWMFITSFKSPSELLDFKQSPLFVIHPTLEHYRHLFTQTNFARWSLNTTVVAVVSTMLSLVCSVLAGYSLARLRYPGASTIGWGIFVTYLVPPTLLFLPLAFLIRQLHLFNNLWS